MTTGDYTAGWQEFLGTGDRAFNSGQFEEAVEQYAAAADTLPDIDLERDVDTELSMVHAVILHRMGATEMVAGHYERAGELFEDVVEATTAAKDSATDPIVASYADELASQSRTQVEIMLTNAQDPGASWQSITFTPTCQHGCPAITVPCSYSDDHCG